MEIWTAFVVGLVGSLHCIGMCGPIAVALPIGTQVKWSFIAGRVLYNLGRVLTYTLFGLLFGFLGESIFVGGYQNIISIVLGALIILAVLIPTKYTVKIFAFTGLYDILPSIKKLWHKLFYKGTKKSLFVVGILNGFLPCGFVYVGVAGAISTGSTINGALYMFLFGLGTVPVMLIMSLLGKVVGATVRRHAVKMIPIFAIMLGTLFILRGMSLGIPYISPKIMQVENAEQMGKMKCH